ncbi:MAG: HD domain-containing protein [Acidobacteria bacterium]|nr:HD domain-containing protein [Acidobacteriota bacterium]
MGPVLPVLFLLVALGAGATTVQTPPPRIHDVWSTAEGLPQRSVNDMIQDRQGYLWLATFGGLVRFDGRGFKTFAPATSPGLTSIRILSLLEDSAGRLWIGTQDAGVIVREGESFRPVPMAKGSGQLVWVLAEGTDGSVWAGCEGGLLRYEGTRLAAHYGVSDGLPVAEVLSLTPGDDGTIWVGTREGLARYSRGKIELIRDPAFRTFGAVYDMVSDEIGSLWVLMDDTVYRLREGRVVRSVHVPAVGSRSVGALAVGPGTGVWVGGAGLYLLPRNAPDHVELVEPFRGNPVRTLERDSEGSLWVGTDGAGLHQFRTGRATTVAEDYGLPDRSVTAILEDSAGTLWAGSLCGGLYRANGPRFERVLLPSGAGFGCVYSLFEDRRGGLWVGHEGLTRIARDGRMRHFEEADGLPAGSLYVLFEDDAGTLWIGTDRSLARLVGGRFEVVAAGSESDPLDVRFLTQSPDGVLWIGTTNGIATWKEGEFHRLRDVPGAPQGRVRAIWFDDDGAVWVGTYGGGLGRLYGGRWSWLTTDEGLAENVVSRILADGTGHVWLSGNRGISRLSLEELRSVADGRAARVTPLVIGEGDGLTCAETNGGFQPAGWRSRDGRLWFPTTAGIAVIDPARLRRNPVPPPVVVEEVRVGGRRLAGAAPLHIPAGARNLEFRYAALALAHPEAVEHRYRLRGFDDDWVHAGDRRLAFYSRVPPGRYEFQVIAANEDGVWNKRGASLPLVVEAHFYETTGFKLFAVLVVLALVVGSYRLRVRGVERRRRLLEAEVEARTRELSGAHRRTEQHLKLLSKQDEELKRLNRNLARLVDERTRELRETRDATVLSLAGLAELRDGTTGAHLERIAAYSRRLAEAMDGGAYGDLGAEFIEQIARSSPLHDIGKVGVPDLILRKPGPLTVEERKVMEEHTNIGGNTLRATLDRFESQGYLEMAMDISYSHHERWDGTGYPLRLAGEAIPLAARIVALVDVYDALTSERPYKRALPHEQAIQEIVAERGTHFDPAVVEAFLEVCHEFPDLGASLSAADTASPAS